MARGQLRTQKRSVSKATLNRKVACRARESPSKQSSPLHVPAYLREGHAAHDALARMKAAKQVTWKQVWHRADFVPLAMLWAALVHSAFVWTSHHNCCLA